jgi:hypothetical protein
MSLTQCPACGVPVSKAAAACPACGHPLKAKSSGCGLLIALSLGGVAFLMLLGTCSRSGNSSPASPPAAESEVAAPVAAIVPPTPEEIAAAREANAVEAARIREAKPPQWIYEEDTDAMSDRVNRTAVVGSENSFELGFPYEGRQYGALIIRQHPRYGVDAMISIYKGQMLCRYNDCTVDVRFDDGPVRSWQMNEPESNDSTMLFFQNPRGFIEQMRGAQRARVQIKLFQNPPVTLDFTVKGFDNDRWRNGPQAAKPEGNASAPSEGRS